MIVKSPAPEIPGDFSGGFVLIRTKILPEKNSLQFSYTTGFNSMTHFHDFKYNPGGVADAFGFGSASRDLNDNRAQERSGYTPHSGSPLPARSRP